MGTAWGRPPAQAGRWGVRDASKSQFRGTSASAGRQRRTLNVRSAAAHLLDFCQVLGSVRTECLYAHGIPIVATFPDVREPTGGGRDVTLLRDAARYYARTWEDHL